MGAETGNQAPRGPSAESGLNNQSDISMNDPILQQALKAACCILLGNLSLRMRGGSVETVESRLGAVHPQKHWLAYPTLLPQRPRAKASSERASSLWERFQSVESVS